MNRYFSKVCVMMGGPSSEYEVSLRSGAAIVRGLEAAGYDVASLTLDSGEFTLPGDTEAVFIAMHGEFGEDGTVQGLLEGLGIPYTGPGVQASRDSFDKKATKEILSTEGIPIPDYRIINSAHDMALEPPVVVKPLRKGSSIGVHRVMTQAEWFGAAEDTLRHEGEAIVEEFIEGRELTVGIVGQEVLPVLEICAPEGDFSYEAKYTKGRSEFRVPALLSAELTDECQRLALGTYRALGCRGMSRVDMRLDATEHVYILENNSIPGFTETSLLPKAAQVAGIDFSELCRRIMESATLDRGM